METAHKRAARTVGTSRTAVDKRLAKLRQRFGVGSTAALVALMVERDLSHLPPESLENGGMAGRPRIVGQAPRGKRMLSER